MFLLLSLGCLATLGLAMEWPRPRRPNIVLFVMDDVGYADTQLYDNASDIATPNLLRLSTRGVLLDRYYSMPVCSPSRAALMLGRWAWKTGLQQYSRGASCLWGAFRRR